MSTNKMETLVAKAAIKCPSDKFYNFFKLNTSDIVKIFPASYTGVELLEGEEGQVGCVKLWHYVLGVIPMTAKVKVDAIDDAGKAIKFVAMEGDVLQLYKTFNVTLRVGEGFAEWTMEYEKVSLLSPPPELYVPLVLTLSALVDAYLLLA